MAVAMPQYLWLVITGAFGAFGFGWGTGEAPSIRRMWNARPSHTKQVCQNPREFTDLLYMRLSC